MSPQHGNRESAPKKSPVRFRTTVDWIGLGAMVLLILCSIIFFIQLMSLNMLTTVLSFLVMILLIILNGVHIIVQMPLRANKLGKIICSVIAIILSGLMIYGTVAVSSVQSAINRISGNRTEVDVMAVIVLKDSGYDELKDLEGAKFGALEKADSTLTLDLLDNKDVVDAVGVVTPKTSATATELAYALYNKDVDAIILNESYISVLTSTDEYADFSSKTKIIYEHKVSVEIESTVDVDVTREAFVVYLSGIDAREGQVTMKTRSDVNIIAVINPTTHQAVLINTPRDYYLPLDFNGEMDKLTHAGIYGIEESMAILGNLYETEISYYARLNFNGLMDIVDAIGGIDVNSDYSFTTIAMDIPGYDQGVSCSFEKGMNHLSGIEALAFARERKNLPTGDVQRGINQMAVIKAIVNKATSPSILKNYDKVLDAVGDNVATNMTNKDISKLVQAQLKDMSTWNIVSYTVSGSGDTRYTYTYGNAWVMWPDDDMVNTAKTLIQQVINGETPTLPE